MGLVVEGSAVEGSASKIPSGRGAGNTRGRAAWPCIAHFGAKPDANAVHRPQVRGPKPRIPPPPARRRTDSTRRDLAAIWARVVLGVVLGAMITQSPYAQTCGLWLVQYFGAIAMVMVTGAWIAAAAWSRRHVPSHLLALLLVLWGMALASYEILPRVGYGALRWTWQC